MSVRIHLPTALRPYAGRQETVELEGASVQEALDGLAGRYAQLRKHLFTEGGTLRNFVNVYVNDTDIRQQEGLKTPLKAGDTLLIVPSIAGGASAAAAAPEVRFSPQELRRYGRHLIMPEVGLAGQRKLKQARVLCVGAGGLGSPLALYLAAAGVGRIGIVDSDVVEFSNLQRQVLHSTDAVGKSKLESAVARLKGLNPDVEVVAHETRLSSANALEILRDYDIVADGTDNFPTRYLVNDACVLLGKPNVYGSIFRFEGQVSVFHAAAGGPCYRCLYPEPPPPGLVPSCAEGGVLGVLPGVVGTLQAVETIKLILGLGRPLTGTLMLFDALAMEWKKLKLRKDPGCPLCGTNPTIRSLIDYEQFCGLRGEDRGPSTGLPEISVENLKAKQDRREDFILLDVREPGEAEIARIPGSRLIPLAQLPERVNELDTADEILVHCKMGGRSARAVQFLLQAGFKKVANVAGGIDAWSERIDPSVPQY